MIRRLLLAAALWLALAAPAPASAGQAIHLTAACQADEDLWIFDVRAPRKGTLELSWQPDGFVFDTVDVRPNRTVRIYVGEPDPGSQTLFVRYAGRHGLSAAAELSFEPCS